jgi:HSP20 family protein
MNLVRWNPMLDMFSTRNRMNPVFDDFFSPLEPSADEAVISNWRPTVDIYENENHIVIKAELPGVDKKDVHVDVNGRVLTLKGERMLDRKIKEENYFRQERTFGKFERSFTLPAEINSDKINADFKGGVLKVDIPKPEEHKPQKITIH